MRLRLAALAILLAPSIPRPVGACSLAAPNGGPHELDPAESSDTVAPGAVDVQVSLYDGQRERGCSQSTCGDLPPAVHLVITSSDNRTPPELLGYRLRVVRGQPPVGSQIPSEAVRTTGNLIYFNHSEDDSFDFDLEVRAVDLNGNLGPATVVTIES
jgi:hypothetical protein